MGFEKDFIAGAVILTIALVAIASPFILYVSGRLGPGGGTNAADVGSLISSLVSMATHFRFLGLSFGSPTLVKEEVINVSEPLNLNIFLNGGGVSVLEWGDHGKVKVEVLRENEFISVTTSRYEYRYVNGVLNVTAVNGYVIRIYVPPDYIKAIKARVSGGGFRVDMSDSSSLRTLNATVRGGGTDLSLGKLANVTITVSISGGGLDGHLNFLGDVKYSTSSIRISIAGGGTDLRVNAPNYAFKVACSASGGAADLVVKGKKHVAVNGNVTYEDPNYANAFRKLRVEVTVSGGGADIWLSG